MGRTLLYCRKSKKSQEGVTDTIDSQEAELRRFAESRGWESIEVLIERGISAGRKAEHKRRVFYGELVPAIESGTVDRVLVVDYDRLNRYLRSLLGFLDTVAKPHSVEVWVTRRNQDATQASKARRPRGRLARRVGGALRGRVPVSATDRPSRPRDHACVRRLV